MGKKEIASAILIVVMIATLGAIGYLTIIKRSFSHSPSSSNTTQVNSKNTPENQTENCGLIRNSTFRSVDKHEGGLGPNGPVMGYWSIVFEQTEFHWQYTDVVESGTYSCSDNVLQAKVYDRSINANYDASRKVLIWDRVEYRKVE